MSLGTGVGDGGGSNAGTGAGGNTGSGASGATGGAAGAASGGGSGTGAGTGAGADGNSGHTGAAAGGTGVGTGSSGETKTWRDTLPDDLKADPTLSKYSDIQNLAKAHIELQKKFGQKGVFKPAQGASAEEIKAFRESMGIPTDPTKYDMGDFDKDVKIDPAIVDWGKKMGAEHGVEPAALKAIITDYMKLSANNESLSAAAAKAEMKKGLEELRGEWGEGFQTNLDKANFAINKAPNGTKFVEALKKFGADNNPEVIKYCNWVSSLFAEDKLREAGVGAGQSTPQELDAQIAQVQSQLFKLKPTDGAYAAMKLRYESLWMQKTKGK